MRRRDGTVSKVISERLRRLEGLLHIDARGQSRWAWITPVVAFAVTVTILVIAGVMSGVWAAEYVPTALVVALVMSGLFVACMAPEAAPPDEDQGDGGPGNEPAPTPPRVDPGIWMALLSEISGDSASGDDNRKKQGLPEPVGTSR
jgi:hypothetical protein